MTHDKPTAAQLGLGDMDVEEFRRAAHQVADQVADYLEGLESQRVTPDIAPGAIRNRLPDEPPGAPEPLERILEDYRRLIEPNITHWQHPGFMAYFPSTASGAGILGEWLSAGLNSNVMFWKNAPASTELEEQVVDWLRRMLGLPDVFDGMLTDTASLSTLLAVTVARPVAPGGALKIYTSEQAHFSVEKAAIVTGVGLDGVRRIATDDAFRMRPDALSRAIDEDRRAGHVPFCVVATLGTTSSTSIDPAEPLASICERERLWLHVDAAYGGACALVPEYRAAFEGWERADSIVFNPHKWMFTPFDASLLLFRDAERFRQVFSVVPAYLRGSSVEGVRNFNEYGIQLGRRFRALKLWMLIRWFGTEGLASRIREHCAMAREFAGWVEAAPGWELLAPVPMATICFRHRPDGTDDEVELDRWNETILERVNATGRFYLSSTMLGQQKALRVAIGNPRATREHVAGCWQALQAASERDGSAGRP